MRRNRSLTKLALILGIITVDTGNTLPVAAAGGPRPQVSAADPPAAEQGTAGLDVTITGKNFDDSSVARFFVTGTTNPGGVVVNSTAFISSKKLLVNIDVDDLAVVDDFDIEVELLASGRKGKGTEKFSVLEKGSNAGGQGEVHLCVTFRNAVGDLFRSDLLSTPTYCHLEARRLIARIGNVSGSFNLYTSNTPRDVVVDMLDCPRLIGGNCATEASLNTLNEWENPGTGWMSLGEKLELRAIEVGETAYADFQIAFPSRSKSTPHQVVFGHSNRFPPCGNPLPVTRVDANTWSIEASTELACLVEVVSKNNQVITREDFLMPFQITLTRQ